MSILLTVKKIVENRLASITPALSIAWEGVNFEPPSDGSKYLKCSFGIKEPDDTCVGGGYYRENIIFYVYVMDKLGIGTGSAYQTAEDIRNLFKLKTTFTEDYVLIRILKTPHIAGSLKTADRLVVPVSVALTVENLM